jgi:hypothetical protein
MSEPNRCSSRDRQRSVSEPAALAEKPESSPRPSDIASLREQVARVEGCTPAADLGVLRAHADGAPWQKLAAAPDTTPEALRKRIEHVRERIRKTLGE